MDLLYNYIINICAFQEIKYFCGIIKHVVHYADKIVSRHLIEFPNSASSRSLNAIAHRKISLLLLVMKTTISLI